MLKFMIYRCNFLFFYVYYIIGLLVIIDLLSISLYKYFNMCDIFFLFFYMIIFIVIYIFVNNVFILFYSYIKGYRIICKWGDREVYFFYYVDNRFR